MKKIIAVSLIVVMVLSLCVVVLSAQTESEEISRVLSLIKERIGETGEYDEFVSSVSENSGVKQYTFRWTGTLRSMNVTVSESGIILSFNKYNNNKPYETSKPSINKMSQGEAISKARLLIDKINPGMVSDLRLYANTYDSLYDEGFSFRIQRLYNGVDVVGDTGYIRVNKDASCIESFNIKFTENIEFDDLSKIIDRNTAIEKYKSELGMVLSYKVDNDKAYLQYAPKYYDKYISAITGELITPIMPEYNLFKNEAAMDSVTMGGGGGSQFTEAEIKNLEIMNSLISRKTAEELIKGNKLFNVPYDADTGYFNTSYNSVTKKYIYSMEFVNKDFSAYVYMDAEDGTVITYNCYNKNEKEEHKENLTLAKSYVEKLASKYYKSDESGDFRFEKINNNTYTFLRYKNDIPCFDNRIYITINNKSEIISYNISCSEVEFDSPDGILSHNEACDSMIKECGYGLYYYPACSKDGMKKPDIAYLIYDTTNKNTTIDAKTGKIVRNYEEEAVIGAYKDIEEHYAKEIIKTLAIYGIGFEGDKFEPDKVITQEEYLSLLASVVKYGEGINLTKATALANRYDTAVRNGIIRENEKNPKEPVTRENAAVFMVRALGFDEVAAINGIYISKFTDVTENIGHISILNGMGVINGFEGKFNPDNFITRADAMIMIYNYLSK